MSFMTLSLLAPCLRLGICSIDSFFIVFYFCWHLQCIDRVRRFWDKLSPWQRSRLLITEKLLFLSHLSNINFVPIDQDGKLWVNFTVVSHGSLDLHKVEDKDKQGMLFKYIIGSLPKEDAKPIFVSNCR